MNGPYAPQISNASKVIDGELEAPVTINDTVYETLAGAMNAWVENNGWHEWNCEDLGIDHDFEVIYLDGTYHQLNCKDCSNSINEKHTSALQGEKDPTCKSEGYTGDEICSVCGVMDRGDKGSADISGGAGENVSTGKSGNIEKTSSPRTGDEAPTTLWIGMLSAACAAVGGILAYRKKCKKN